MSNRYTTATVGYNEVESPFSVLATALEDNRLVSKTVVLKTTIGKKEIDEYRAEVMRYCEPPDDFDMLDEYWDDRSMPHNLDIGYNVRQVTVFHREETLTISSVGVAIFRVGQQIFDRPAERAIIFSRKHGRFNVYFKGYDKLMKKKVFRNITNSPWRVNEMVHGDYLAPRHVDSLRNLPSLVADVLRAWYPDVRDTSINQWNGKHTRVGVGQMAVRIAYPLVAEYDKYGRVSNLPVSLSTPLRQTSIKAVVRKTLGWSGKTLVKGYIECLSEGNSGSIETAAALKNVLPPELLASILENGVFIATGPQWSYKDLADFFAQFSVKRAKTLLESITHDSWMITDTISMWVQMKGMEDAPNLRNARTFQEMHRELVLFQNRHALRIRLANEPNETIPQKIYKGIHGTIAKDDARLEIRTPQGTHEMMLWGHELDHCIGSYTHQALNGRALYLALYWEGELLATAELERNGSLRQLYGLHNRYIAPEIATIFIDELHRAGLMDDKHKTEALSRWARNDRYNRFIEAQIPAPGLGHEDEPW